MIRAFVDSNVLLDFLQERAGFFEPARKLLIFKCFGDYELWTSASQATDLFYILSGGGKERLLSKAKESLIALRKHMRIFGPGEREVDRALQSNFDDFGDALVYQSAVSIDADVIVTRDADGFRLSALPVVTPEGFFDWMANAAGVVFDEMAY